MKKYFTGILFVTLIFGASASYAGPQMITIKDANKNAKEHMASDQIKKIDLKDIEDPAARKAIQEILNYLGLNSKGAVTKSQDSVISVQ